MLALIEQTKEKEMKEAELKMKAESGCCIVEHGWRMEAEHKLKEAEKVI